MGSGGGGGGGKSGGIIRRTWEKVKNFFGGSSEAGSSTGREDSYDPEKARMEETIRINNILTTFRLDVESKSDRLEQEVLDMARESLDRTIQYLATINEKSYGGRKLNLNLQRVQRENRKTEDMIRGFIKKEVQKKVSLDNAKCLEILKMPAGAQKEREMTAYADSVLKQALNALTKKIETSMNKQCDNLLEQIQDRMEQVTSQVNEKVAKSLEISKMKEADEAKLQMEQSRIKYAVTIFDIAENQFN